MRGTCSKQPCPYPHVRENPIAVVCKGFSTLGYCESGVACPLRHVFECSEYSSKGSCSNTGCRLPHVDRAGQLRQQAAKTNTNVSPATVDLSGSSDIELHSLPNVNETDAGGVDEHAKAGASNESPHSRWEQQDYVHL